MANQNPEQKSGGALLMYMPALHDGYLQFIDKHPDDQLGILDEDLLKAVPALERDVRAINPGIMQEALSALYKDREVNLLGKRAVSLLPKDILVTMPDEDISHEIAEEHFGLHTVEFEPVFLRWDKQITTHESVVPPHRIISTDEFDREIISIASEQAAKSHDWWRQVGAALVKDKKVVYAGYNDQRPVKDYGLNTFGDPKMNFGPGEKIELSKFIHAEATIIATAAKEGVELKGCSIYVTTFPCPVCARLLVEAGIEKVFYQDGYSVMDAEDVLNAANVELVRVQPAEED